MVYDLGAVGKESMIRLLAKRAVDAAGMGVEIARWLRGSKRVKGEEYFHRTFTNRSYFAATS